LTISFKLCAALLVPYREDDLVSGDSPKTSRGSKVVISGNGITKLAGDTIVAAIPREEIRQIKLEHESCARYPFAQYFLGFILLVLGLIGLLVSFLASIGKTPLAPPDSGGLVLPLLPIFFWLMTGLGLWLVLGILRCRYLLKVITVKGIRKIFFEKSIGPKEIRQMLRKAELSFGYSIDLSILEKKPDPT